MTHILYISKYFSGTKRKTNFRDSILNKEKIHYITAKEEWVYKIEDTIDKNTIIQIREWQGVPCKSSSLFVKNITESGFEILTYNNNAIYIDGVKTDLSFFDIAKNDGLTINELFRWFGGEIKNDMRPLYIVHFTEFRYLKHFSNKH